jgi:hypothetical protein
MTTKLTVNSENNGTLKQNNSLGRRMMRLAATALFAVIAFASMSFTQDDTTKRVNESSAAVADSCCVVTFVSGNQQIVITNTNAFTAEVKINNMDINTWVNSLKAYTYKRINLNSIGLADKKMDVSFTLAEQMNRKMAVAFSKNLATEGTVADDEINNQFSIAVAAPSFSKTLSVEAAEVDASVDNLLANDAENRAKASAFRKAITAGSIAADEEVDLMVYGSTIKNNKQFNTKEADSSMDALMNKSSFTTVAPSIGGAADQAIDALMKKMN